MKEIISTAGNIFFNDKLNPSVELIIVSSEPEYILQEKELIITRKAETFRFIISPQTLREIAKQFVEYADEADKSLEKVFAEAVGKGARESL